MGKMMSSMKKMTTFFNKKKNKKEKKKRIDKNDRFYKSLLEEETDASLNK